MKFISPYYFLHQLEIKTEWIGHDQLLEIIALTEKGSDPLFTYEDYEISKDEAKEFLASIDDEQSLKFCLWVHSIEPLEQLLHEHQIQSDKPFEVSQELEYSGQLQALLQFIAPYLKVAILEAGLAILESRKFDDYRKLDGAWKFLNDQTAKSNIGDEHASPLIQFFDDQTSENELCSRTDFSFLKEFEFVDFCNAWPFSTGQREQLLKSIKEWEPLFRNKSDEETIRAVLTNLQAIEGLAFQLNFDQPKPDESYAEQAIQQIRDKQAAQQAKNKKAALFILGIVAVFVIGVLVVRNNKKEGFDQESEYAYDQNTTGGVQYSLQDEQDFYGWSEEDRRIENKAFDEQIEVLKRYADKNNRGSGVDVEGLREWLPSAPKNVHTPFTQFFHPLSDKEGGYTYHFENESRYGVIILIKSTPHCYAYFLPSHSYTSEYLKLNDQDEFVFYFGKTFTPTYNLLNLHGPAGFEHTDDNTKRHLRKSYLVGWFDDDGLDDQIIRIVDYSRPIVTFQIDNDITTFVDDDSY